MSSLASAPPVRARDGPTTRTSQRSSLAIASNLASRTKPRAVRVLPMPGGPMSSSVVPCARPGLVVCDAGVKSASSAADPLLNRGAFREANSSDDADCDGGINIAR